MNVRTSSMLLTLALSVPNLAQAQLCDGLRGIAITGDGNPTLTALTGTDREAISQQYGADVECNWFMEQECFENEPGGANVNLQDGSLHRFTNAVALADQIPFFGQSRTWEDVIHDDVAWVEPHPECRPYMSAYGANGDCRIDVSRQSLRRDEVWLRAAAFLHENRHCHLHDLHGGECPAGAGGCDHAFEDEGAYQWTVEFLAQFASFAPSDWNSAQRADAITKANGILSLNFEVHPGFHYFLSDDGASRRWTFTDTDFESPAPDPAFDRAITKIELAVLPTIVAGRYAPGLQGMRVTRRHVNTDGSLGATFVETLGDMGSDPNQIATADAGVASAQHVLTGVRIGWGSLPVGGGTTAPDFGTRVSFIVAAARIGPDGDLFDAQGSLQGGTDPSNPFTSLSCPTGLCAAGQVCVDASCVVPAAEPDAATATSAPGEVLVGFGLGTESDSLQWGDAVAHSRLPPAFLPYRGGGEGEWLRELVSCPSGSTAMGVLVADDGSAPAAPFLGTMALICQPDAELAAGTAPSISTFTLAHPTFETTAGVTPAAVAPGSDLFTLFSALAGHSPTVYTCPQGFSLRGLSGRAGALIDRLDSLECRSPSNWDNTVAATAGGPGGAPFSDVCPANERVDGFLVRRDGPRLRGIAPHCGAMP